MSRTSCALCILVGAITIIGALNWGLVGLFNFNLVEFLFGVGTTITRIVYILVGLSGLALLLKFFIRCPVCKRDLDG